MDIVGIPLARVRCLHIFLFASDYISTLRYICGQLLLYLSKYGLFCEINAFDKKEYKMVLDSSHCDLCIAEKDVIDEIKTNYHSLSYSIIELSDSNVYAN